MITCTFFAKDTSLGCRAQPVGVQHALDNLPREQILEIFTSYEEILWQVADAETARQDLTALGYRTVKTLVQSNVGLHIVYAANRVHL